MFLANVARTAVRGRWARASAGIAAVAVLIAVPALGFAHLGSAFLPSTGADEDAATAAVADGVLVFDAPASTLKRVRSTERQTSSPSSAGTNQGADEAALLTDFKYTALRSVGPGFIVINQDNTVELALIDVILAELAIIEQLIQQLENAHNNHHHHHHSHHM
jgi:hypothetical protein